MSTAGRKASSLTTNQTGERVRRASESGRVPAGGWLRAMREARGVPQSELAAKLGFKRQAWAQFEASEARGAISLASLRRGAEVLECDLEYRLIPRAVAARAHRAAAPSDGQATLPPPVEAKGAAVWAPLDSESEFPMELR